MHKSVILPQAKQDIREAALWYNKRSLGLGKRFTTEVRNKVNFIKQNPTAFNLRYDKIRTAVLDVFPFMIHFTVDEKSKTILITAVIHTSRDPGIWKTR